MTAHPIKELYTLAEIEARIASHNYSAELLLHHAMELLRGRAGEDARPVAWSALTDEPAIWELASKFFSAESSYEAIMGFARALLDAEQPSEKLTQAKIAEQPARYAIDGAIAFGRTGQNEPPAGHWLTEYWHIGRQLAKLGETSIWDNQTPVESQPTELPRHALDAWRAVVRERRRQIAEEGWTPEHDDEHADGQLAQAAATYAAAAALDGPDASVMQDSGAGGTPHHILAMWPWDMEWWKPKDRRRNLERAGALILAELERDIRAKQKDAAIAKGEGK